MILKFKGDKEREIRRLMSHIKVIKKVNSEQGTEGEEVKVQEQKPVVQTNQQHSDSSNRTYSEEEVKSESPLLKPAD